MIDTGSTELVHEDFQVNPVVNATEDTAVTNDPNTDVDSLFNENLDFGVEEEEHPAITSICGHDPVSEFDSSDQIITTSFPCVFLLGHAYERSTGIGQQCNDVIYLDSLHLFLQKPGLYWATCLML